MSRVWYGQTHRPAYGSWLSRMICCRICVSDSCCRASGFALGRLGSCNGCPRAATTLVKDTTTKAPRHQFRIECISTCTCSALPIAGCPSFRPPQFSGNKRLSEVPAFPNDAATIPERVRFRNRGGTRHEIEAARCYHGAARYRTNGAGPATHGTGTTERGSGCQERRGVRACHFSVGRRLSEVHGRIPRQVSVSGHRQRLLLGTDRPRAGPRLCRNAGRQSELRCAACGQLGAVPDDVAQTAVAAVSFA